LGFVAIGSISIVLFYLFSENSEIISIMSFIFRYYPACFNCIAIFFTTFCSITILRNHLVYTEDEKNEVQNESKAEIKNK